MHILLTAFDTYDDWQENSSWLAMIELLREMPPTMHLTTRRYPVELSALRDKLAEDLSGEFDAILQLGQSPGACRIKLETFAINAVGDTNSVDRVLPALDEDGPEAFRTGMPVERFADRLQEAKIPAALSYHAGTYLCNAAMYLTHAWLDENELNIPAGFIHLPLATEQVIDCDADMPSLPRQTLAKALRIVLEDLMQHGAG